MIFLSEVSKKTTNKKDYPFSVPTVSSFDLMKFSTPITFLIGENGTGKSTFLESLAVAIDSPAIGEASLNLDHTLLPARNLAKSLKLSWKMRTHKGFFIRSEDVFGFTKYLQTAKIDLDEEVSRFENSLSGYGRQLAVGSVLGQKKSFEHRYGQDLDANSHGETFLKVFGSRFVPGGLYLLDEPETPLSFNSQLSLLLMLREMVKKDAQFIIATHSPILTSLPEARIFSFDDEKIHPIEYKDIKSFQLVKDFMNHPEAFLSHLQ